MTPTDPFEEGEQTLIRPDHRHREDLEEPGEDFERVETGKSQDTSESTVRGERSNRTLKKPKYYKDESDGCIDTWIEVMKLHFGEENISKKQECSALTSNLEATALSCVMAKRTNERDSARKIFDILLNPFGSDVQGHQAMKRGAEEMTIAETRFWMTSSYSEGEGTLTRGYRNGT